MTDPFEHDDAAYLLGALDDDERAAFEAHLETCAQCRARVAALRPTAGALALVPAAALEPPPETLLPGLVRAVARERRRRRWVTGTAAGVAAACVIALAAVLWPGGGGSTAPAARAMRPVADSPVHASAALVARRWGTEIDLTCRYDESVKVGIPYRLRVIDRAGTPHDAGSWLLVPDRTVHFTGGTDVALAKVKTVEVTLPDGTPILTLSN